MYIPLLSTFRFLRYLMFVCLFIGVEPVFLVVPTNVSAIVDRNLTLTCVVDADPIANVNIQKREPVRWNPIVRGANHRFRISTSKNGTNATIRLFIRRLLIGDSGEYRCTADWQDKFFHWSPGFLSVQGTYMRCQSSIALVGLFHFKGA